jgi:hypothetical protein
LAKRRADKSDSRKRGFGPGRSRLRQAQGARRHGLFNLWYQYSPRLRRDVVLRSDVEFAHFCWLEGEPNVLRYELEPVPVMVAMGDESRRTQFDAFVEFRRGRPQLREIKTDEANLSAREIVQREAQERAAATAGFDHVHVTQEDLAKHVQLIRNWRCALAYQAACRELVLEPYCAELLHILQVQRRSTFEVALRETDPTMRPIYLAALFRCLQEARLASDLDSKPLCAASQVWVVEVEHG